MIGYEAELIAKYEARADLIVRALSRKYPQVADWKADENDEGDLRLVAGTTVRIVPSRIFKGAINVLDVFTWIEENCNL